MQKIGTYTEYSRTDVPETHPFHGVPGIRWTKDEQGLDWYDTQKSLPATGYHYICVNADNLVMTGGDDVSMLFPAGMTLYQRDGDADVEPFLGQVYDPVTDTFAARPVPQARQTAMFRARIVMKTTPQTLADGSQGTLWDAVQAAVAGLTEPTRTIATEALDQGNTFSADSPVVKSFTAALGIDETALLAMIAAAEAIAV